MNDIADILMISERKTDENFSDAQFCIDGYSDRRLIRRLIKNGRRNL